MDLSCSSQALLNPTFLVSNMIGFPPGPRIRKHSDEVEMSTLITSRGEEYSGTTDALTKLDSEVYKLMTG